MKKHKIIPLIIITIAAAAIILRLALNKQGRDNELESISCFTEVVPITADTVRYSNIALAFSANGSFKALKEVIIASETQGKIKEILAETGDYVTEGKALARTDNDILISQLNSAKANYEKAEKDMKRYEKLSGEDAASQHQYEAERMAYINAETDYQIAKKQYTDSYIKAPCSGMLTGKYIEIGTYVTPGSETFEIVDISKMKFIVNLTADEINGLTKNEEVEITVDNYPGEIFTGKVKSIVVKADESKRYEVEVEAANNDRKLKPGMYGTAMFKQKTSHNSLIIKRKALSGSIEDPEVYVISGNTVSSRKITAIPIDDKYLEVKSGLSKGELIVVSGQINLKNGSKIKIN